MEFWGAEIKSGETIVVERKGEKLLHLSQACLVGKKNKDTEPVYLFAKVGDQKFVIGILSSEKIPRVSFDLVFRKPFELSHTSKYGSIHVLGYRGSEVEDEEPDSEPEPVLDNQGTSSSETTTKAKDASEDESSDDEQGMKNEEESSDDERETDSEDSDDSDEEKEKVDKQKAETSKKRPAETATKTPSADKKVKLVTPEKSASKISGNNVHVATPYPKKPTGKVAAKSENITSPFECKPCKKSFGSDVALQSHTKAKHGPGK